LIFPPISISSQLPIFTIIFSLLAVTVSCDDCNKIKEPKYLAVIVKDLEKENAIERRIECIVKYYKKEKIDDAKYESFNSTTLEEHHKNSIKVCDDKETDRIVALGIYAIIFGLFFLCSAYCCLKRDKQPYEKADV
jgi:hypothetical protein